MKTAFVTSQKPREAEFDQPAMDTARSFAPSINEAGTASWLERDEVLRTAKIAARIVLVASVMSAFVAIATVLIFAGRN